MENCIEIKELNKFYGKKKQAFLRILSGTLKLLAKIWLF